MTIRDMKLQVAMNRRTFIANSAGASLVMSLGVVLPGCGGEQAGLLARRDAE